MAYPYPNGFPGSRFGPPCGPPYRPPYGPPPATGYGYGYPPPPYGPPYGSPYPYPQSPFPSFGHSPYGHSPYGPSPIGSMPPQFGTNPIGIGHWKITNKTFIPVEISHAAGPPFTIFPRQTQPLVFPGDDRMVLRIYSLGNLVTTEISTGHVKASAGGEVTRKPNGQWVVYYPMASLRITVTTCHKIIVEADNRGTKK